MRKSNRFVSFLVAAILGLAPMSAFSAPAAAPVVKAASNSSVLSIDPVGWTYGSINLQYENAVSDSFSWTLPISVGFSQAIFTNPTPQNFSIIPGLGLKYYITGKAANYGLYAHGIVQAQIWQKAAGAATLAALAYAMNTGYSHSFGNFWLDGFAGLRGPAMPFTNATMTEISGNAWVPVWNVGVKIGYAW